MDMGMGQGQPRGRGGMILRLSPWPTRLLRKDPTLRFWLTEAHKVQEPSKQDSGSVTCAFSRLSLHSCPQSPQIPLITYPPSGLHSL